MSFVSAELMQTQLLKPILHKVEVDQPITAIGEMKVVIHPGPEVVKVPPVLNVEGLIRPGLENMRILNPVFAETIVAVGPPVDGVPRDQVQIPISPIDPPTDTTVLETNDPNIRYFVPTYRLATEQVGGLLQYRATVTPEGAGARLTIVLEPAQHPDIAANAPTALAVGHSLLLFLEYSPAGSGIRKSLPMELIEVGTERHASLYLGSLEALDELYTAVTTQAPDARVVVRRVVDVAVPVLSKGDDWRWLWKDQRQFVTAPTIASGFLVQPIWEEKLHAIEQAMAEVTITEPVTLYRTVTRSIDWSIPFHLDKERHGYVFSAVNVAPTGAGGGLPYIPRATGDGHRYLQDKARLDIVYYLPDRYELARRPKAGFAPLFSITSPPGAAIEDNRVVFTYVARPHVDQARLERAAEQLATFVPNGAKPNLRPLPFIDWKYRLTLPGQEPQDRPRPSGAGVDGFSEAITMSREVFQPIWDAMAGTGALILFSGSIEVSVNNETITIPFQPKLSDLGGADLFTYTATEDPASGKVMVELTNAIESRVHIGSLRAALRRGEGPLVPAAVELAVPQVVEPGGKVSVGFVPASPVPGSGPVLPVLDLSGATIEPNLEAILQIVLDVRVVEFSHDIDVVVSFPSSPAADTPKAVAVLAYLGASPGVELTPGAGAKTKVKLARPFADALLGRPLSAEYEYFYVVQRNDAAGTSSFDTPVKQTGAHSPPFLNISVPAAAP